MRSDDDAASVLGCRVQDRQSPVGPEDIGMADSMAYPARPSVIPAIRRMAGIGRSGLEVCAGNDVGQGRVRQIRRCPAVTPPIPQRIGKNVPARVPFWSQ